MVSRDELFFPKLNRRDNYKTKRNGEYYATYGEYRQEIREDCLGRCVYCDIHENENGGKENMQLDHFRPNEKYDDYKHINHPNNLHWSCGGCNRLKTAEWPSGDPEKLVDIDGENGFIDPFEDDRNDYLEVGADGKLKPLKHPATYKIALLALNRPSRRQFRIKRMLTFDKLKDLETCISKTEFALQKKDGVPDDTKQLLESNKAAIQSQIDRILEHELNYDLM